MRGSFRRDAELRGDPSSPGAFLLARRPAARSVSRILIGLSLAAVALDLWVRKPWLALLQLAISVAFLLVHLIAEARSWRFAGDEVVLRTLELRRFRVREEKLRASEIAQIGIARLGTRAQAWLELKDGESYALIEGRAEEVEKIAGSVRRAVLLANLEAKGQTLH